MQQAEQLSARLSEMRCAHGNSMRELIAAAKELKHAPFMPEMKIILSSVGRNSYFLQDAKTHERADNESIILQTSYRVFLKTFDK